MKFTIAVAALAALLSAQAAAQSTCPVKEYAQYKDEARTHPGLITLAFEYCSVARRGDNLMPGRAADQCEAERSKISSALSSAGQHEVLSFAIGGCNGEFPDPKVTKKSRK